MTKTWDSSTPNGRNKFQIPKPKNHKLRSVIQDPLNHLRFFMCSKKFESSYIAI